MSTSCIYLVTLLREHRMVVIFILHINFQDGLSGMLCIIDLKRRKDWSKVAPYNTSLYIYQ